MAKKAKKIEVEWTGSYPNLCSGEWIIKINGVQIKDKTVIDEYTKREALSYDSVLRQSMATSGEYQSWHFEDWNEVFEDYFDGYDYPSWKKTENTNRLFELIEGNGISLTGDEKKTLFSKIQELDWRNNSCGGCI